MDAFAFEITLLPFRDLGPDELVLRTIALRGDQTLEQLHEAMRLTFGWADPHLYRSGGEPGGRTTTPCVTTHRSRPKTSMRRPPA